MLNPTQIDLLEQFYTGSISPKDRVQLDSWRKDPKFEEEEQLYLELFEGFSALELDAFNANFQKWEKKYETDNSPQEVKKVDAYKVHLFFRRYRMVAAAIAIILLAAPLGYLLLQKSGEEDLFATYFKPEDYQGVALINRAIPNSIESKENIKRQTQEVFLNKGMIAYHNEAYRKVIEHLEQYKSMLKEQNRTTKTFNLYLGIAYLAEEEYVNAKQIFESLQALAEDKTTQYSADWYLALSYMREKNNKNAKKVLEKIIQNNKHHYQTKAKALLTQLEKCMKR